MKTQDLVALLAAQAEPVDARDSALRVTGVVGIGLTAGAGVSAVALGINPLLSAALGAAGFWLREAFCLLLAAGSLVLFLQAGRPGASTRGPLAALALCLGAFAALAATIYLHAPASQREDLLFGQTARACPWLIALVSLPAFAGLVLEMRHRAPTRLHLAGAACGFCAGAIGALGYTLHCPELSAPFVAVWYVLGMSLPALVGSLAGPRLLRW